MPARLEAGAGIVHLGLGNFARAHTAVCTAAALAREPGPGAWLVSLNALTRSPTR